MQKLHLIAFTLLTLFFQTGQSENVASVEKEKNTLLSSSELLGCNPLKGFKTFAIHPQYSISSPTLRSKIEEMMSKELGSIGKVIHLKIPDVTGYGKAEARITLMIKDLFNNSSKIQASQISLFLASSVIIKQNKTECSSYIWSIDSFIEGLINDKNESLILPSLKTVCRSFIDAYQAANKNQKNTPIFYLYIL